jgi:hypothetical protein
MATLGCTPPEGHQLTLPDFRGPRQGAISNQILGVCNHVERSNGLVAKERKTRLRRLSRKAGCGATRTSSGESLRGADGLRKCPARKSLGTGNYLRQGSAVGSWAAMGP